MPFREKKYSEHEASFGKGNKIEMNTFETKQGKPIHFYTEDGMITEFNNLKILDTGLYTDKENHGSEGEHEHILRYIVVQN